MSDEKDYYDYLRVKVDIDTDGEFDDEDEDDVGGGYVATFEYKTKDGPPNRMRHDEDVRDYSDDQLKALARQMLDAPEDQEVEVQWA